MARLNVQLSEQQHEALRAYALRRRTPVSSLIKEYVDYLLAGGDLVTPPDDVPSGWDLAVIAERGGSFDWLADEPDLYSLEDGEPV